MGAVLKVRYTLVHNGKQQTISALTDIENEDIRRAFEQRLLQWSHSLREQSLRHFIERQVGREMVQHARIIFQPKKNNLGP